MPTDLLQRREVVANLLKDRNGLLVVTGLGSSTYDVMAAGDHDNNYYLWGAMGSAPTVGLGLALARPQNKVLIVTGDGELLMGMGALATIAVKQPQNLTIAVLDNGHYGETGMQQSHTHHGIQMDKVAESCGFDWTTTITDMDGVHALRERVYETPGTNLAVIRIDPASPSRVLPPRDGVFIKNRFRAALGYGTI